MVAPPAPRDAAEGGLRVVIDMRPLQEPDRSPITSAYLEHLARSFARDPRSDDEFVMVTRLLRSDPTPDLAAEGLAVVGRRRMPATARASRPAAMALDALLLRLVTMGAADGPAVQAGPRGVFHSAGGAIPLASRLPLVATLLDLAPWELPERYAESVLARLARRLRGRALRRADRVIVPARATATSAVSLLGLDPDVVRVVPLAAADAFVPGAGGPEALARLRAEHVLPERYLAVGGRYDARSDLPTVLRALAALSRQEPPADSPGWPPRLVLVGASGHDPRARAHIDALVDHHGVAELVSVVTLPVPQRAVLLAGAVAHVQPQLSDATGVGALEALAAGTPVVCSRTGALPESVGPCGIVVEPRDPARMATALRAAWEDGPVARQVTAAARRRAEGTRRSWADVATEVRAVLAEAASGELP